MTIEERLAKANEKEEQYKHQKILQDNRRKVDQYKINLRRKILLGEIFIKHFPIVLEFTPGKSSMEDSKILELLEITSGHCQNASKPFKQWRTYCVNCTDFAPRYMT